MEREIQNNLEGNSDATGVNAPAGVAQRRNSFKKMLRNSIEIIVAVLLVILFFFLLMWMLGIFFPAGTDLRDLIKNGRSVSEEIPADQQRLITSRDGEDGLGAGDVAATITSMRQSVKYKAASGIVWESGRPGMSLHDQDAVQTFNHSSAVISFDTKNHLNMGPNSLVIVRRMEQDMLFREKRSTLVMMEGELSGLMSRQAGNPMTVEIALPGAIARMHSGDSGNRSLEYKVKVNPDKTSTVAVFSGEAEVVAQGRTIKLLANQVTTVAEGKAPTKPRNLLPPAVLTAPADQTVSYFREVPREIEFKWRKSEAGRYRFVLSRDKEFQDVLLDEVLSNPHFLHGNLPTGEYYWQVADVDADGASGWFSDARKLSVDQDLSPPSLEVDFPSAHVVKGLLMLKGIAEPGAMVYVDRIQVNTSAKGEFAYQRQMAPGINVVVVEAIDVAGNITYRTQLIDGGS